MVIFNTIVTIVVGFILFLQNNKISKVQKTEIEKVKADFERQSKIIGDVESILKIYDVDRIKRHIAYTIELKENEHKHFTSKLENSLKDLDVKKFELIKFCLGALKDLGEEKQTELLDLYFPKNKKEFMLYIKKLNI